MKIEILDWEKRGGSEHRIYEIDGKCSRVLIDSTRNIGGGEVWGFIDTNNPNHPRQVEGKLIDINKHFTLQGAEND